VNHLIATPKSFEEEIKKLTPLNYLNHSHQQPVSLFSPHHGLSTLNSIFGSSKRRKELQVHRVQALVCSLLYATRFAIIVHHIPSKRLDDSVIFLARFSQRQVSPAIERGLPIHIPHSLRFAIVNILFVS
jgi:hypothetical protein